MLQISVPDLKFENSVKKLFKIRIDTSHQSSVTGGVGGQKVIWQLKKSKKHFLYLN